MSNIVKTKTYFQEDINGHIFSADILEKNIFILNTQPYHFNVYAFTTLFINKCIYMFN